MKKLNNRKCIITNSKFPKSELIRIVKTKNGEFIVNSNEQGRGAYVKNDISLLPELKRKKLLNRSFKMDVPNKTYEELEKILKEG